MTNSDRHKEMIAMLARWYERVTGDPSIFGMIKALAGGYAKSSGDPSIFDDLVQESYFVYLKCAEGYEADKALFKAYFKTCLKRHFARYLCTKEGHLPMSGKSARDLWAIRKYIKEYVSEQGIEPTDSEIADTLGFSVGKVRRLRGKGSIRSLDEPMESGKLLSDIIEDRKSGIDDAIERVYLNQVREALNTAIDCLSGTERDVIILRYHGMDTKSISEKLEIPIEGVRYCYAQAIKHLRMKSLPFLRQELDTAAPTIYYRGSRGFFERYGSVVEYCAMPENKKP